MIDVNLTKLQHFFEVDFKIKQEMYNNAPPAHDTYFDNESICKYTNNLEASLKYIFAELKDITVEIFGKGSPVLKRLKEIESATKKSFYSCGFEIVKLRNFYKNHISNMEISFIDAVKENCVGYKLSQSFPIAMANTVNEVLHLIHSYVLNNETILQAVPAVAQKQNNFNYPITLRGNASFLFYQLYEQFPDDLNVGWTDIVILNENKLLMMVRDRGHALTIEVTVNNNVARIEYFIPKLCNIDMVNALPGINKVNYDSVGATGIIETNINCLSETIFDFISKVPTDDDITYERRVRI